MGSSLQTRETFYNNVKHMSVNVFDVTGEQCENEQTILPSSHLDVHDVRVVKVLQEIFHFNEN